jgi:multisubunit Na+/H+ antiporter MnhB subunit
VFLLTLKIWQLLSIPRFLKFDLMFDSLHDLAVKGATVVTKGFRSHRESDHLPIILGAIVFATLTLFIVRSDFGSEPVWDAWNVAWQNIPSLMAVPAVAVSLLTRAVVTLVLLVAAFVVFRAKQILTRLVATSLIGLLVTLQYVFFKAPDLALTQILVETLVLVATVVLLVQLKAVKWQAVDTTQGSRKFLNASIALGLGLLMAALMVLVEGRDKSKFMGHWFNDMALPGAAGTNVVNTILIDFRGTDTLFEITVLVIAVLGCIGLLGWKRNKNHAEG